jgi:hypothetical protein
MHGYSYISFELFTSELFLPSLFALHAHSLKSHSFSLSAAESVTLAIHSLSSPLHAWLVTFHSFHRPVSLDGQSFYLRKIFTQLQQAQLLQQLNRLSSLALARHVTIVSAHGLWPPCIDCISCHCFLALAMPSSCHRRESGSHYQPRGSLSSSSYHHGWKWVWLHHGLRSISGLNVFYLHGAERSIELLDS